MSHTLRQIAEQLRDANKKMQLLYAFNGSGKTRLSREFKGLIAPKVTAGAQENEDEKPDSSHPKVLYYNTFTEDLFYWDNDLTGDLAPKLKIQPNSFTNWALVGQGLDQSVIANFQCYTSDKLSPKFNTDFSEVSFSFQRGNNQQEDHIKLSKGEESNFIWSEFYTLLEEVVETLNIAEEAERDTDQFNRLEYVFIDDPVSSLDENHLIDLAVNIASIIKHSESDLKFFITTHNPLFYNVLHNEFGKAKNQLLRKHEDGTHSLDDQNNDSPFAYHLYLKGELEKAIQTGQIRKFHFNFLRNLLEKTSTFLGYEKWADLLPRSNDGRTNPYEARMINLFSHSKHSAEEVADLDDDDTRMLGFLFGKITATYRFKAAGDQPAPAE
jgi:hypothetical protein